MEPAPSIDELRSALVTILTTMDNVARREAEVSVVRSLKNPQTLFALVQLLRDVGNTSAGVRQLSAVLLRKKLFTLWRSLSPELQVEFKSILLQQLGLEPVKIVRFAVAHVVSILTKAESRDGGNGWPELQGAIAAAMSSEAAEMRELAMVLAYSIAEVFGEQPSFINGVGEAVARGLDDPVLAVRLAALKAVSVILPFLHGSKDIKNQMIAVVVPSTIRTVQQHYTDPSMLPVVLRTLDLVEQMCEDLHTNSHEVFLRQLTDMLIAVYTSTNAAHMRLREYASEVLSLLVQTKPKFISKCAYTDTLVTSCLNVMSEDATISLPFEYDEEEDEMDDDEVDLLKVRTSCMFAARLLNRCCSHLSAKAVTASAMQLITAVLDNPQASPLQRKAAIIGLACLAEGNPGYLRRKVTMILNAVRKLLSDPDATPREAAAFALIYFSDHLQPEILTHHTSLMPMLMSMIADPADAVRNRVAETLDKLCENIADDLDPYIPQLMPLLLQAIPLSTPLTQETLVSAMSSIAQTQCPSFAQFGEQVLSLLQQPMSISLNDTTLLRAKATEAVGIIAVAMGKERFQPYFQFFMDRVVENLSATRAEVKEQSFGFLANMCEMLGADFIPYLDDSIQAAIASITRDVSHTENKHLLAEAASINLVEGDESDKDSEDEDDNAEEIHIRVRTADVEEKSSAVYAIGVFAEVLKVDIFGVERLQQCWQHLMAESGHFHPNIRSNVLETLTKIAIASQGNVSVAKSPTATVFDTLSPVTRNVINELLFEVLYPCLSGEVEKEVVAAACDALNKLIGFFGNQTFAYQQGMHRIDITDLCSVVAVLLRQEAPCQTTDEDAVDSDGENDAGGLGEDHDHVLMDAVCDIVDGLAAVLGADFEPYFRELAKDMLPYLAEGRPAEDFTMAAGVMANCFMSMGSVSEPYFDDAMRIALRIIYETDESAAKANCCFIVRALIEHCPHKVTSPQELHQVLKALWDVAGSEDEIPQACDNAISAACTIVQKLSHLVPLGTVVPALLKHIPMKVDKDENKNAIACVAGLLQGQTAFAESNFACIAECCARIFLDRSVDNSLKQSLGEVLYAFASQRSALWTATVAGLHSNFQRTLAKVFSPQ